MLTKLLRHTRKSATLIRITMQRAPKNLLSNRFWNIWGGTIYLRSNRTLIPPSSTLPDVAKAFPSAKTFIRWSKYLRVRPIQPEFAAITCTELGMFGNMTRRLATGLTLSLLMRLGHFVVPRQVIFQTGVFKEGIHKAGQSPSIYFGRAPKASDNPIEHLIQMELFRGVSVNPDLGEAFSDRAWALLGGLLEQRSEPTKSGETSLTIHVRGGDVFGPRKPRAYGQPPLSFYELILEHREWDEVTIVHQDALNPVLPGLIRLCEAKGITPRLTSGALVDDVVALLEAVNVVAGRGTFVPAVAGLSPFCRRVYYFEDKCSVVPPKSGITLVRVADHEGRYRREVLSGNWENSRAQRDLMVSYPITSLGFVNP